MFQNRLAKERKGVIETSGMSNSMMAHFLYLIDRFEYFEICPSQILGGANKSNCLLQHAFGNLARMFSENWEFDLSNLQSAGV
jgi:hypothetical protein